MLNWIIVGGLIVGSILFIHVMMDRYGSGGFW
jgi:hypothetical protein